MSFDGLRPERDDLGVSRVPPLGPTQRARSSIQCTRVRVAKPLAPFGVSS